MAVTATPIFPQSGLANPIGLCDAVSTDRTGAGTYDSIGSVAGSNGAWCWGFDLHAVESNDSNVLMIFYNDGTLTRLFREIPIPHNFVSNNDGPPLAWHKYEPIFPNGRPLFMSSGDKFEAALFRTGKVNMLLDMQNL